MTDKSLHLERWWDIPAAFILMTAVMTSGTRLVVTNWTDHLSIVQTVVFFGDDRRFSFGIQSVLKPLGSHLRGLLRAVYYHLAVGKVP